MFQIVRKVAQKNKQQINIYGGKLGEYKFSIHETNNWSRATSCDSCTDLKEFLCKQKFLRYKETNDPYHWWDVDNADVIYLINLVLKAFEFEGGKKVGEDSFTIEESDNGEYINIINNKKPNTAPTTIYQRDNVISFINEILRR